MRGQRYQRWWDGLSEQAQPNFAAGAFQGVERSQIPPNGFYAGVNVLTDDDGSAYKRGGSAMLSIAGFGTSGLPPLFVLDAYLSAGQRTLFADQNAFGVLDATESPLTLGGGGVPTPKRAAVLAGVAVIGGGQMYAGSLKVANYTTGTISTTLGSKVVTGTGTTWNTLVDAGMFLRIGAERYYVIASVDSTTQVTLTEAYEGTTAAGKAYTFSPLATCPRTSDFYAAGFDRLVSIEGDEVRFSRGRSPGTSGLPPVGNLQFQTFDATDLHKLPGGVQGAGAYFLRDTLFVFSTGGVYAVSNMAYNLTDAAGNVQQTLTRISPDLTLWSHEGIAAWGDAMIVPATDGVWLLDGQNPPQKISRSIDARYLGYVRAGHRAGLAITYRNHYLLPIVNGANVTVEILACRLDRPQRTSLGIVYPWTWLTGDGARCPALSVRVGSSPRQPKLIGGGAGAPGVGAPTGVSLTTAVSPGSGLGNYGVYFYKVTAIVGSESNASAEISKPATSFGPARQISVTVSWNPVPGATGYRVYRGTTSGGENTYYAVGGVTSFTDTGAAGTAGTPPGAISGSRILDLSGYFEPAAANKQDHNSANFELDLTTRDFTPDRVNIEALIKKMRLRYELIDAASDDPTLSGWYSVGVLQTGLSLWDAINWGDLWAAAGDGTEVQLAGQAPEGDGRQPFFWTINTRARFIRFRFRSSKPAAKLVIRNFEVFSRTSGKA